MLNGWQAESFGSGVSNHDRSAFKYRAENQSDRESRACGRFNFGHPGCMMHYRSAIANQSDEPLSAFRVLTMTPALERLAELVRQAEAKTRARKIEAEAQQAAEQFRAAELRARQAVERFRQIRPASVRAMEQADADEQLLKDLVRKLALYKSSLGSEADAERLIAASQAEIERTRQQSQARVGRD